MAHDDPFFAKWTRNLFIASQNGHSIYYFVSKRKHNVLIFRKKDTAKIQYAKKRYAKNTYGPKCQNTHGPKLWLLDTWAWAHGPGRMGRRRPAAQHTGFLAYRFFSIPDFLAPWKLKIATASRK